MGLYEVSWVENRRIAVEVEASSTEEAQALAMDHDDTWLRRKEASSYKSGLVTIMCLTDDEIEVVIGPDAEEE
jgi:hypothetical protein